MPIEHTPGTPPIEPASHAERQSTEIDHRRAALDAIAAEVRTCTRCRLATSRTHAVPGEGDPDTEVVFVGEGPGSNEDRQGKPFVGAAGQFLTELIRSIGWRREEVYITNVVKCRPPGNRDPEPDEIAACAPYLQRQLEVLDPALVVTLGRFSLQSFMPGARIGQVHGMSRPIETGTGTGTRSAQAYAMYHPASAFRQQALRETIQMDMCAIPEVLIEARAGRAAPVTGAVDGPADPAPAPYEAPARLPLDDAPPAAPDREPEHRERDQLSLFR